MTDLKALKRELRQQALSRRDGLDPAWRIEASLDFTKAANHIDFVAGTPVSGFLPIKSEVDLRPLMAALRKKGARLCVPAILDKTTIVFRELLPGAPMIDMGFGTMGPGPEAATLDPEIMLVPLAAFDRAGNRIGYGGGYYDRAIAGLNARGLKPRLIGIAFDCQQVDTVPCGPHDVPLREILTENGLHRFGNA